MTGRTGDGDWMECRGGMVISYKNNPEYAQTQIKKMGDAWKALPNCSVDKLNLVSQLKEVGEKYATRLGFELNEACYFYQTYNNADINVLYDPEENKLFLLYMSY